jgi:acyl-CoA thioester hydrolase
MTDIPEVRFTVQPEWVDYNGHMNMGFYLVAFDVAATDPFYEWLRIGEDYVEERRRSVFTLAANIDYLAELFEGDEGRIATRLIDWDRKRLHYFHTMYDAEGTVVATNELLGIHVDMETRKSVDFDSDLQALLGELAAAHDLQPQHERVGRALGIRR